MMKITNDKYVIKIDKFDNNNELENVLQSCTEGNLHMNNDGCNDCVNYFSVRISSDWAEHKVFGIGFGSAKMIENPYMFYWPNKNIIVIGNDFEVVGVDLKLNKICFKLTLDTVFYRFSYDKKNDYLLIFHEIGLVVIDSNGEIIVSHDKDILNDCIIDDNKIVLKFEDGTEKELII